MKASPECSRPGATSGSSRHSFEAGNANLVWHLTGKTATANASSQRCTATLELRKVVVPAADPGEFNLLINDDVAATGKGGFTTGPKTVGVGEGSVRETAGANTSLADYDSSVECTRNGTVAVSVPGTKVDGAIARGDVVVCTFTNVQERHDASRTAHAPATAHAPDTAHAPASAHASDTAHASARPRLRRLRLRRRRCLRRRARSASTSS